MKRILAMTLSIIIFMLSLTGCKRADSVGTNVEKETGKLNIITTIFPYYDFVRQIAGDSVNVTMLVPTGMDTHSFEPTPGDMVKIQDADIFIYNGGEMESWVEQVLDAVDNDSQNRVRMMDYVTLFEEELVEGMEAEEHEHEHGEEDSELKEDTDHEEAEYDEHIWTSPANAKILVSQLCNVLKEAESENAKVYEENAEQYIEKLTALDNEFKGIVETAKRKTLVFGDKFPLRYFVEEYGLDYSAAFSGCSTETEPSAETVAYLINKVKEEQIPVVYYLELSNGKIADTICEATDAKKVKFNTCHNVTQDQFDSGITYLELMEENVEALKRGLN